MEKRTISRLELSSNDDDSPDLTSLSRRAPAFVAPHIDGAKGANHNREH
jgi:hypothetical protein